MRNGIETEWVSGEVTLHDGAKLKGMVRFNEVSKIISFKENADSKDSRSFKESKVFSLFLVDSIGKKRNFYSFEYQVDNVKEILLFEVIKEFKEWAVLARKEAVQAIEGKDDINLDAGIGGIPGKNIRTILAQGEGIYAIDQNGEIELIQFTTNREVDGFYGDYSRSTKHINKEVLQKYMKSYFSEVDSFAKRNKLKLKVKSDLLKIFEYYETLISNN